MNRTDIRGKRKVKATRLLYYITYYDNKIRSNIDSEQGTNREASWAQSCDGGAGDAAGAAAGARGARAEGRSRRAATGEGVPPIEPSPRPSMRVPNSKIPRPTRRCPRDSEATNLQHTIAHINLHLHIVDKK